MSEQPPVTRRLCLQLDRKYLSGFLLFGVAFAGATAFGIAVLTVIASALSVSI